MYWHLRLRRGQATGEVADITDSLEIGKVHASSESVCRVQLQEGVGLSRGTCCLRVGIFQHVQIGSDSMAVCIIASSLCTFASSLRACPLEVVRSVV